MSNFNKCFDTFVEEKDIDTEHEFEFKENGMNHLVETACVIAWIKNLNADAKAKIKSNFVKIDFCNGNPMHFFEFLAKGMIKATYYKSF